MKKENFRFLILMIYLFAGIIVGSLFGYYYFDAYEKVDYHSNCFWEWQLEDNCNNQSGYLEPDSNSEGKYWNCISKTPDEGTFLLYSVRAC